MRLPTRYRWVAAALAALVWTGCKTLEGGAEVGAPDYASDAESNLARGREALDGKNFLEAERYFEHVRSKYPFLEAAKEAELLLADTDFQRERYLEARDRYASFVKLHPTHPKLDYAAFRAALTHYKEIPSDLFILPPAAEKDQTEVKRTLAAMTDFMRQYPSSSYAEEAKKIVDAVKRRLAEHELYVAEFYAKREKWPAVVGRLTRVLREFSGLGFDERAYFGIYAAYVQMKDTAKAQETLRAVIERLPGTPAAERARKLLGAG